MPSFGAPEQNNRQIQDLFHLTAYSCGNKGELELVCFLVSLLPGKPPYWALDAMVMGGNSIPEGDS